jgi:hypothetical protein
MSELSEYRAAMQPDAVPEPMCTRLCSYLLEARRERDALRAEAVALREALTERLCSHCSVVPGSDRCLKAMCFRCAQDALSAPLTSAAAERVKALEEFYAADCAYAYAFENVVSNEDLEPYLKRLDAARATLAALDGKGE